MKKLLVLCLVGSMISLGGVPGVNAQSQDAGSAQKETRHARKTRGIISSLGVGPEALVKLKLRDKTELKGYVSKSAEQDFVVTDRTTGVETTVTYEQVQKIDKWQAVKTFMKRDLSSPGRMARKVAIGAAITAGALIVVCLIARCQE